MKTSKVTSLDQSSAFVMLCHDARMAGEGALRPPMQAAVGQVLAAFDEAHLDPLDPMRATVEAIRTIHRKGGPLS